VDAGPRAGVPPGAGGRWLADRLALCRRRLLDEGFPTFSPQFVLADVALDPGYPRLYSEFSGDLSGRTVEVLARMGAGDPGALVRRALAHQRKDGRFGDERVAFDDADRIDKPHMALLWGNGRLLVGLLAHHEARADAAALAAARRLGDFLLAVRAQCSQPSVARRLERLGAHGVICFTQLIEGLVMLARAAGDRRYAEAARAIAPLLPPRGVQHSHGYLSTLRGILLLHEAQPDPALLALVEERWRDLVRSADHLATGGVLEFFGNTTPNLAFDDLRRLYEFAQKDPQDEGCSEADVVRLALGLWRATGKPEYLDAAERCLLNHLFANQFHTGDFGHRPVFLHGFRAAPQVGMAWWCCTMHGARALCDVRDALVSRRDGLTRIDLFLDGVATGADGLRLELAPAAGRGPGPGPGDRFLARVSASHAGAAAVGVRRPPWATRVALSVNGRAVEAHERAGALVVDRRWRPGDRLEVAFDLDAWIETRDRRRVPIGGLGERPTEGVLFVGPWLLGVHEAGDPLFFRRPWAFRTPNNDNVVRLPARLGEARVPARPVGARDVIAPPPVALRVPYAHGGWPQPGHVTLRPLAALTGVAEQQTVAMWLPYARA
jgi:DUF1680 family protein